MSTLDNQEALFSTLDTNATCRPFALDAYRILHSRDIDTTQLFCLMADMTDNSRVTTPTKEQTPVAMARDFIAGMTNNFFIQQTASLGCKVPPIQ